MLRNPPSVCHGIKWHPAALHPGMQKDDSGVGSVEYRAMSAVCDNAKRPSITILEGSLTKTYNVEVDKLLLSIKIGS